MNNVNDMWNEFLEKCESHEKQQEAYRASLIVDGVISVRKPCCPRFQPNCFEDYCKYRNGEKESWECALSSDIYYYKNHNDYVSIEDALKICKERGIELD